MTAFAHSTRRIEVTIDWEAPSCEDAADTNDDGVLNLTDAVVVLEHLFLGGAESLGGRLPCWIDFTPDELTCDGQDACRR